MRLYRKKSGDEPMTCVCVCESEERENQSLPWVQTVSGSVQSVICSVHDATFKQPSFMCVCVCQVFENMR